MMIDKQHPQQPAMANDVIEFTDAIHLYYMKKLEINFEKLSTLQQPIARIDA